MALSISRRVLRSFGSLSGFGRCGDSSSRTSQSFRASHDLYGHVSGDCLFSAESSSFIKGVVSSLAYRRLSTSNVTSESTGGSFPSDLLSPKECGNTATRDRALKDIIHRVVRWQLAKRQQGTHSTKTISEVSGTGRKPYRQKGTGRARHGTLRGPQFRGGAVMHGPKPRSHAFKLNKKVRRLGLKIALSARAAEGKLLVFEDLEVPTHKTKNIVNYVNEMENTKKLLVVDGGPINEKLKLATQNLHYVNVLPSIGLNVYSILQHDTLVMSRDAVNKIVERMHTPIKR
ncbi:50S RIBOSOMAL PROTEIN L4 [Salix viminalis]|uniref:Large ribosomal subunit protein uL4m n=1 Tax=Salix viminalis TaxID=40686 RepID=A0A9Q0TAR4_SALVM|nr:50S RIBOSOMAL PROTEIN L4 [Salix viminalis]